MQVFTWDPSSGWYLIAALGGVPEAEGPAKQCPILDAQKLQDDKPFQAAKLGGNL